MFRCEDEEGLCQLADYPPLPTILMQETRMEQDIHPTKGLGQLPGVGKGFLASA
jgi:hypothetical protein